MSTMSENETVAKVLIRGEPSVDPSVCTFHVNRPLLPGGSYTCTSRAMAEGSPLLEDLFEMDGVLQVLATGNRLVIAKGTDEAWPKLGKRIGTTIRERMESGGPLFSSDVIERAKPNDTVRSENPNLDTPEAHQIRELLDLQINPAVASHGGHVALVDVRNDTALIRMEGGCQGCAMSRETVKKGIERSIQAAIPKIRHVMDVTDHESGVNPYFREAPGEA